MPRRKTNLPASRLRIAVVLSQELGCFRDILRGFNSHALQKPDWHLDVYWPNEDVVQLLRTNRPDGLLIGPFAQKPDFSSFARLCKHMIGVAMEPDSRVPTVGSDDYAVGQLAADYFLKKGFEHFAFLGIQSFWSVPRQQGFVDALAVAGRKVACLTKELTEPFLGRGFARPHYSQDILEWIEKLPKPLAVLAANDLRGRELLELLRDQSLRVPDDLAVLGVDDDELECELARPPLSSVAVPWNRIGFEAATLLDRMMSGEKAPKSPVLLPPVRVAERQSTDIVAVDDPDIAAAVRFIRQNAHRQIGVTDILKVVPAGRRAIERRFQQYLGRSPLDEIRRVRIDLAKRSLITSDRTIAQVARECGFSSLPWFCTSFRDLTGQTPAVFRRNQQTIRQNTT